MSEMNNLQEKKNNGGYIAVIVVLAIGMAVLATMWSTKNSQLNDCTNENTALKADMEGMNEMMQPYLGKDVSNNLVKDFQNMLADYDKIIEQGRPEDQAAMSEQQTKIKGLLTELESAKKNGKVSASLLAKMKRENETLRQIMVSYVKQIDELNTKNMQLSSDLDKTSTELSSTKSERDKYKQDVDEKTEQVKKGARLQAFNFSSGGLKMRLNNTTDESSRARAVDQIKSSFTLSENPLTTPGRKVVYMQIINPDGKTLQSKSSNSVATDLGTIAFSDSKEIDYQNQRIDLAIYYDLKGEGAIKGNYKVKIYCDGALIGTDSFTLK